MNLDHRTLNSKQSRRRLAGLCAAGVLAAGAAIGVGKSGAQPTNTPSGPSLDSFRIITRNNIFDPNRYHYTERTNRTPRPIVDAFSLVGTMSYSKGRFAFFDGAGSQYKKVLEPGGDIAGYTVKDITQTNVTLAANGKEIAMDVGSQMRKEEGSGWKLSVYEEPPAAPASNDSAAADTSTAPVGENAEQTEALKRLMQLRQQELNSK